MTQQQIRLVGWVDPENPSRQRGTEQHEFRLKLSALPSTLWKKVFGDQLRDQNAMVTLEQDILYMQCDLAHVVELTGRVKQWFRLTNQIVARMEQEADERAARQSRETEELRLRVLEAVKVIHFDDT